VSPHEFLRIPACGPTEWIAEIVAQLPVTTAFIGIPDNAALSVRCLQIGRLHQRVDIHYFKQS